MADLAGSQAPLSVAIDIKNPLDYLALEPTLCLADDLGIAVDWLPFVGRPPARQMPGGIDRRSRHLRWRAANAARELERYAAVQGLILHDPDRAPDTALAGMALLAARARGETVLRHYLRASFEGYWSGNLNIDDRDALAHLLAEAGVRCFEPDPAGFEELQEGLREAGIFRTPAYRLDDELFIGRAHLPMIRWILEGRRSPPRSKTSPSPCRSRRRPANPRLGKGD